MKKQRTTPWFVGVNPDINRPGVYERKLGIYKKPEYKGKRTFSYWTGIVWCQDALTPAQALKNRKKGFSILQSNRDVPWRGTLL